MLEELAATAECHTAVRLTAKQDMDGTREECVLRFFAFLDRYQKFDHSVEDFLDGYMRDASENFTGPHLLSRKSEFMSVFSALATVFPGGILRPGRKGTTPLNLFEGVAVGAALAMRQAGTINNIQTEVWMASPELRKATTGATNTRSAVRERIEFCRDRFLGLPYVPVANL